MQYNQARVYRPGTPVLSYDEHHMLPPMESKYKPGTTLTLIRKPSVIWGDGICKDMGLYAALRQYGRGGCGPDARSWLGFQCRPELARSHSDNAWCGKRLQRCPRGKERVPDSE